MRPPNLNRPGMLPVLVAVVAEEEQTLLTGTVEAEAEMSVSVHMALRLAARSYSVVEVEVVLLSCKAAAPPEQLPLVALNMSFARTGSLGFPGALVLVEVVERRPELELQPAVELDNQLVAEHRPEPVEVGIPDMEDSQDMDVVGSRGTVPVVDTDSRSLEVVGMDNNRNCDYFPACGPCPSYMRHCSRRHP